MNFELVSSSSGSNDVMIRGRLNERLAVFSIGRYNTGGVLFRIRILVSREFWVVWWSGGVVWRS